MVAALGCRHDYGFVHRRTHPRNARMDYPQRARPHRHRAHLSGFGKNRRHRRRPDLGFGARHLNRAGRTRRGLFHPARRRVAALCTDDGRPPHRHRIARRLHHGEMVSRPPSGKLPLHAFRRNLRNHESLRRIVQPRRRPAPRLHCRCQRRIPIRRIAHLGRIDRQSVGT